MTSDHKMQGSAGIIDHEEARRKLGHTDVNKLEEKWVTPLEEDHRSIIRMEN